MKFTFRVDPHQKAFWGRLVFEVERLCVHLGAAPPLQGTLGHIGFQGEFHGSMLPLPEVLLRPTFVEREGHTGSQYFWSKRKYSKPAKNAPSGTSKIRKMINQLRKWVFLAERTRLARLGGLFSLIREQSNTGRAYGSVFLYPPAPL